MTIGPQLIYKVDVWSTLDAAEDELDDEIEFAQLPYTGAAGIHAAFERLLERLGRTEADDDEDEDSAWYGVPEVWLGCPATLEGALRREEHLEHIGAHTAAHQGVHVIPEEGRPMGRQATCICIFSKEEVTEQTLAHEFAHVLAYDLCCSTGEYDGEHGDIWAGYVKRMGHGDHAREHQRYLASTGTDPYADAQGNRAPAAREMAA
jgi:hypothetical protein